MESYWSLIVDESSYCRHGPDGEERHIGSGLFCGMDYTPSNKIAYFRGNVIVADDYALQENQRYGLAIGTRLVLDCSQHAAAGICKASMCNDYVGLFKVGHPHTRAIQNCVIVINTIGRYAYIHSTKNLKKGGECLVNYGDNYVFTP